MLLAAILFVGIGANPPPPMPATCNFSSPQTMQGLTAIAYDRLSAQLSHPATNATRCVYSDHGAVVLTLDLLHYPTEESAHTASERQRGDPLVPAVFTADAEHDEVFTLEHKQAHRRRRNNEEEGDDEGESLPSYGARHGSTLAVLTVPEDLDANLFGHEELFQAAALTAAGATIVPPESVDLCALNPVSSVQTLVRLSAANGTSQLRQRSDRKDERALTTCRYDFVPLAGFDKPYVKITRQQYSTTAAARDAFLDSRLALDSGHTLQPGDLVGTKDILGTFALHGNVISNVQVSGADREARDDPSYRFHNERIALLAAGATPIVSAHDPVVPTAVITTTAGEWKQNIYYLFRYMSLVVAAVLFVLWRIFQFFRRTSLSHNGLPGTAYVNSIGDTGLDQGDRPLIRLHLTISPQNGEPFDTTVTQQAPRLEAPASLVGRTLPIRIDPKNPKRFVFLG